MNDDDGRSHRIQPQRNPKVIGGVVAIVLFIWFVLANLQQVEVTWWVFSTQASLVVVILLSALLGAGITFFFIRLRRPRDRSRR